MTLDSGLPEEIGPDEDLVRFLFSGDFNSISVKPRAFRPTNAERVTSVYRHGRVPLKDLWILGDFVASERGKELKGAAFFKARDLAECPLEVHAVEPPPRHAEITGWIWPEDPEDPELTSKLLLQALVIANACGEPFLRK